MYSAEDCVRFIYRLLSCIAISIVAKILQQKTAAFLVQKDFDFAQIRILPPYRGIYILNHHDS